MAAGMVPDSSGDGSGIQAVMVVPFPKGPPGLNTGRGRPTVYVPDRPQSRGWTAIRTILRVGLDRVRLVSFAACRSYRR
jgi:hypothetical protein